MSKTAKIKAFKYAFLKPKPTDKKLIKTKTEIEKAVKSLKKAGYSDEIEGNLQNLSEDLAKQDKAYLEELIHYKVVKHWDDPKERKFWMTHCSTPETNVEIAKKLLKDDPSKERAIDIWKQLGDRPEVTDFCYAQYPKEMEDEFVKSMSTGAAPSMPQHLEAKMTMRVFDEGNAKKLSPYYKSNLPPKDVETLVKKNPGGFIKAFIEGEGTTTKMKYLGDPKLREALKAGGDDWDELMKSSPLLPFLENAKKRVKPTPDKSLGEIDSMFAELVDPNGALKLTYYTNSLTTVNDMLASSNDDQVKAVQERKEEIRKDLEEQKKKKKKGAPEIETDRYDAHPDGPGTQCDVLVSLMSTLVGATLGPDVKCKHIVFKGMVLTDVMSKFPGGLLSSSFGGNVYDDSGTLTGQVLFTGGADDGVSNAHTILEVNGMQYDAVLGTSGKNLSHTVVDEFPAWDKTGYVTLDDKPIRVSKSTKSAYWIINEPGLKAAPNKHGFGSAYRMTNKPEKYVKPAKNV